MKNTRKVIMMIVIVCLVAPFALVAQGEAETGPVSFEFWTTETQSDRMATIQVLVDTYQGAIAEHPSALDAHQMQAAQAGKGTVMTAKLLAVLAASWAFLALHGPLFAGELALETVGPKKHSGKRTRKSGWQR